MENDAEHPIINSARKLNRAFDRKLVTSSELVQHVVDELAASDTVLPELIPEICESIPVSARNEFKTMLASALKPGFTWRPFLGVPMTEQEIQLQRELHGNRIRVWADLILKHLNNSNADYAEP